MKKKYYVDDVEMTAEEFNDFLSSREVVKARLRRTTVEELEVEFEEKNLYFRYNDVFELSEVDLYGFVECLFGRRELKSTDGVIPFEEIGSREYGIWVEQKRAGRKAKGHPDAVKDSSLQFDYSGYQRWKYNPVLFYKERVNGELRARHRLLLLDDYETMKFLENREFAIMSPVTYVGKSNSYKNARFLYAFGIDLDGVGTKEVIWLLNGMESGRYPIANIIVNSGHGIHVYFLLKEPIAMYEWRIRTLNKLKAVLTKIVWLVSQLDNPQIQSVVQGFRLPGTKTKFGRRITAFYNYDAPMHTPESLNGFLGSYRLSDSELGELVGRYDYNPDRIKLEAAKEQWPEWYQSRVIEKKRIGTPWKLNRGLYDWWLEKLQNGNDVMVHHRYWCILTLVIYAKKCGVDKEEVLKDALALVPSFDVKTKTVDNPFTEQDVMDAMRAYDGDYAKWPIRVIESTTGIRIQRNKRNGRCREIHLKVMNAIRDGVTHPNGEWRKGSGRKKSTIENSDFAKIVREWRRQHPESTNKSLCARETGLSRPTVHRWWDVPITHESDEKATDD